MARSIMTTESAGGTEAATGRIDLQEVDKVFTPRRGSVAIEALRSISLDVRPGEFVSLVGPSGCGKSTLLKMIAGLLEPSSGRIAVDGVPVEQPRRSVGMMPRELSGGMQQRVALCRVLVSDPSVVLMDEPFGALDEFARERLNVELLRIWEDARKTIVFVTHNINEAVFLSDRVVVMGTSPGRVLEVVDVPLGRGRPRTQQMMREPAFTDCVFEVRGMLGL